MNVESSTSLLIAALHWRVVLSLVLSAALALVFVAYIPWLTIFQAIPIVCLGFLLGFSWEVSSKPDAAQTNVSRKQTSFAVLLATAVSVGFLWGFCSGLSLRSFVVGAVLLALFAAVWVWCIGRANRRFASSISSRRILVCLITAAVFYPLGAWLFNYLLRYT